jgi:hypothetical protein
MADAPFGALGLPSPQAAPQTVAVGDYQMPAFPAAAPVDPLMAPDGLHFADRRPGESVEGREARLQPFYQAVGPLMQQYSPKAPETWTPSEMQKFQKSPKFVAAASLAFPR